MHVARLNIGMAEYNTMGKQRGSKNRCVIHGIRDGTLRRKGNTYLVILVSWILVHVLTFSLGQIIRNFQ